jgi:benzoate-CoA ligase family protein
MTELPSSPVTFAEEFNLADYFLHDRVTEGRGDRCAIRFGAHALSYAQMSQRTHSLAAAFIETGVQQEQRVLMILPDLPGFALAIFATLEAGAVVAMGNPDAPTADLAYLIEYTRAAILVTVERVAKALERSIGASGIKAVYLAADVPTDGDPFAAVPTDRIGGKECRSLHVESMREFAGYSRVKTKRDDIAVWLFTSGSTGKSKAAIHTHRDFAYNTEVFAKRTIGMRESDVTVSVPRLFFGYATGTNLWFPFAVGATAALFSERPTAENLLRAIERYRPTVLTQVPTMIGKLLDHDEALQRDGHKLDLSCLRFCFSAGEALPPTLLQRWNARFGVDVYDGIGSAEMFHIYLSNRPGDITPGSLGRVVEGYEVKLLSQDATGPGAEEVPLETEGVLWVKGDSVALGYFQDRDKSWSTFHGHWCRTGDLFRKDSSGHFWFGGRADELLKISGQWVSPIEVEECMLQHPAVMLCAYVGVDGGGGMLYSRAYIQLKSDYEPSAELAAQIQEHVKSRLTRHKYPREVRFCDDLPRNDRGKIDRKSLKELANNEPPALRVELVKS